ncbi:unnamed protein product [Gongylonema pulchrum]|uniref:WD_REPEATS_REGION domain-containing protein n=1 Tax=Gongylonema pulchrum TaxID=637853 RepID=A0A183DST6_9BILA|nr:unnamed protein product [Gongylonema pulchrum]
MDGCGPANYRSQFGGAKFSRIRWLDPGTRCANFLTSTYDCRSSEIAAWSMIEGTDSDADDLCVCECKLEVSTDVNDLVLCNAKRFAAAMNDGSVRVVAYDEGVIEPVTVYSNLHAECSCNALCFNGDRVISGGQGGTLGLASVRSIETIGEQIFVSAHLDGQICLWDLRKETAPLAKPTFSWRVTEYFQGATAIGFGTEEGGIGFLDTRQSSYILNTIAMPFPVGTIWEVICFSFADFDGQSRTNVWLSRSVRSGNAFVTILINGFASVNTFDVSAKGILACSDNQMITYIDKNYLA